jgi:hypothetical protein
VANIQELAASARQKKHSGQATTWPDAARKAVIGKGITAPNDVKRLTRQVLVELSRYGAAVRRANRNRGWRYPRFTKRQGA